MANNNQNENKYVCDLCNKSFRQKIDYTRHLNSKKSCISLDKIKEKASNELNEATVSRELKTVFDSCLNMLRDNEGLVGEKALRTLARLLILRLLEPKLGKEIDIDHYDYHFEDKYEEEYIEKVRTDLLMYTRFSTLASLNENDVMSRMEQVWSNILSVHPATKEIFPPTQTFDIKRQSTLKKILTKLQETPFETLEIDILGDTYETVIKDIMIGKVLGQFFTQLEMREFLVQLVDPQIDETGKCETIRDLAMGTGGLLISSLRHLKQQAKKKNIELDWSFICSKGVTGREIEPDTYQLAVSNMLISTGHMFTTCKRSDTDVKDNEDHRGCLERGDSIRDPIDEKYDICIANPPFGIKGLNYDEIPDRILRNKALPIRTNNAVSLFLQMFIYNLKIGGRGGIILPDGQDLFGKSGSLVLIREYLMKTCDLKEVIYFPSGMFTNTSIKTCVFYFVKRRDEKDVLTIKDQETKNGKRSYHFSKTHTTKTVKFYDYNPYEKVKNLLVEVDVDAIASNSYSLNYAEYVKVDEEEEDENKFDESITIKTLGEVCTFKNGKGIKKEDLIEGDYPVIGGGQKPLGYHNQYNCNENVILCSSSGAYAGFISRYNTKTWISDCFSIKSSNLSILLDNYLYYFLKLSQNEIYKFQNGAAQPHVYSKDLSTLKIPIPSLSQQEEIVEYLDFLESTNQTSQKKIDDLKKLNTFRLSQLKYMKIDKKPLGEICKVNPESMRQHDYPFINYIDISSVNNNHVEYNRLDSDFPSRAKRVIKQYDILYSTVRPNLKCYTFIDKMVENLIASTGFAHIRVNHRNNHPKYIYYMLTQQSVTDYLVDNAKGAQYPSVTCDIFESIPIPVPSLSVQKEIVEYCEKNDKMISDLEKEMEMNKAMASQFLKQALSYKDDEDENENEKEENNPSQPSTNKLDELQKMTLTELKEMAKTKGIKGFSKMKKDELIDKITRLN
jgi:type I restriction-modification system DNA methylase subunit/restriction endonuclease S subunit